MKCGGELGPGSRPGWRARDSEQNEIRRNDGVSITLVGTLNLDSVLNRVVEAAMLVEVDHGGLDRAMSCSCLGLHQ